MAALVAHQRYIRRDLGCGLLADDLLERLALDRRLGVAEGAGIGRIGEQAAQLVALVEGHQRRHAVGHQAQQPGVFGQPGFAGRGGRVRQRLRAHGTAISRTARFASSHARAGVGGTRRWWAA
jgi:hypothetical protein